MNHSYFLQALGWALVNSLWQFGLLWLIFFLSTHFSKKISSPHRHGFALSLSLGGTAWFIIDLVRSFVADDSSATMITDTLPENISGYFMLSGWFQTFHNNYLGFITLLYLVVVTLQSVRLFYSFYQSHYVYHTGLSKARADIRVYVQKMSMQLNIKRRVQVFVSEYVDTPLVIGFLKPTILMPLACINYLSIAQLEAILLHELAHIKRNDYLVNVWVASLEILFFFNPFARQLAHSIKKEREYTCDDWVMQHQFDPHSYASALLTLEKSRTGYLRTGAGIAATGASSTILLHRIQRILRVPQKEPLSVYRTVAGLMVCVLIWLLTVKPAQKELPAAEPDLVSLLASRLPAHKQSPAEHPVSLLNLQPVLSPLTPSTPLKQAVKRLKRGVRPAGDDEEDVLFPVSIRSELSYLPLFQEAVSVEKRNFSIPEEVQPELPVVAQVYTFPYVPSSSFYFSTDTVKPARSETYYEQAAKEAKLKTQKALSLVDWKTIQKRLPASSKASLQIVRKQLEQSFSRLNWQQIDREVRDSIGRQSLQQARAGLYEDNRELDKWKTQQKYLEELQNHLQQQQKMFSRETERKSLELQKELSKARIIIYL